ncbi:MAG: AAA family ATPase [Candidatus Muirbacterium halophilum]|nr:AAA family ATPase [Candidatus Muirbacterium halophilum]MCK9476676.1 AAA family ATPase [Candidatus Muirbacterium halophilum]
MIIKSILLKNYRNFSNYYCKFGKGINILSGNNGCGKSTIFSAFSELILFDTNIYRKNFRNLNDPYFIQILIDVSGKEIMISKDADNNQFYLEYDNKKYMKDEAQEMFQKISGIKIQTNVYRSLFFLQQREWIYFFDKSKNIKNIADIIKNYLSTGKLKTENDNSKKLKNRKKILMEKLNEFNENFEDKKEELENVRAFVVEREINMNLLQRYIKEENNITNIISKKDFVYKAHNDYSNLKKEFDFIANQTQELKDTIGKIEKLEEKKTYIENKLEGYRSFTIEKIEEISRISGILDNKNREILKDQYTKAISNLIVYRNICFVAAMFFLFISIGGAFFSVFFLVGIIFSGIFAILGSYFWQKSREEERHMQIEVQTEHSREVQTLNNELTRILKSTNVSNIDEFKEKYRSRDDLMKNLEKIKNELSNLYKERSVEDIEKDYVKLLNDLNIMKDKISSVSEEEYGRVVELEVIKNEILELNSKKEKLDENISNTKALISKNRFSCEELYNIEDENDILQKNIKKIEDEIEILSFVEEYTKRAHMDIMESANTLLDLTIDKYFNNLTAGDYHDVRVEFTGDNMLQLNVFSKEYGDYVNEDFLSDSTKDALFIAFRLALIELIDDQGYIPVFMDEVFSYFDSKRLRTTAELFKNISEIRQVFYFNTDSFIDRGTQNLKFVTKVKIEEGNPT